MQKAINLTALSLASVVKIGRDADRPVRISDSQHSVCNCEHDWRCCKGLTCKLRFDSAAFTKTSRALLSPMTVCTCIVRPSAETGRFGSGLLSRIPPCASPALDFLKSVLSMILAGPVLPLDRNLRRSPAAAKPLVTPKAIHSFPIFLEASAISQRCSDEWKSRCRIRSSCDRRAAWACGRCATTARAIDVQLWTG